MKKIFYLPTLFLFFLLLNHPAKAQAQGGDMKHDTGHITFNETDIMWGDAPPVFIKGAKMAVLQGDPSKEGEFTVRLSMPANYKISPHWHPTTENVTVLKGDFYLGTGDTFDTNNATVLHTGGFASIPATHHHFAFTKGEAIVQVHAMGPFQLNYINPADDPSKQAK
jgi:hypothetical protein